MVFGFCRAVLSVRLFLHELFSTNIYFDCIPDYYLLCDRGGTEVEMGEESGRVVVVVML